MPATIRLLKKRNKSSGGIVISKMFVNSKLHCVTNWPELAPIDHRCKPLQNNIFVVERNRLQHRGSPFVCFFHYTRAPLAL